VTGAVLTAASSILGMANAAGALKDSLARLASGGSTEAEIRAGNEAGRAAALAAGVRDAASGTAIGRALQRVGGSLSRAATATVSSVTNAVEMARIRRERGDMSAAAAAASAGGSQRGQGGAGGGGGGGGGTRQDPIWERFQREQAVSARIRALTDQEADAVVSRRFEAAERSREAGELRIGQERETANAIITLQQGISDANARLADQEIARAEMIGDAWRAQIQALKQMGEATLEVAAANLLQSGSADKALRAGLAAIGTMAGFRALFEGAEAIAALVTPGMQGFAAGHAKAAAMFGAIAVGTVVAGKAIYGGNYGRGSNGSRGGGGAGSDIGGGFASPRGGGGGGGGPQNVEQTFIIKTSGDMLDSDRNLRRLARHIRDIGSRGYHE
jgi:hypothetical protein